MRFDLKLSMTLCDIEVMNGISHEVAVLHDVGRRIHIELKLQATLLRLASRLHAHLHHTLANCRIVSERGGVPDRVNHASPFMPPWPIRSNNQNKSGGWRCEPGRTAGERCPHMRSRRPP